eukprot:g30483.t1
MFKCSAENLDKYATTVMDFISKCAEDCVPKKSIQVFPNWKPWMSQEIHRLLKTRHAVFKLNDPYLYRKSRYDILKAIRRWQYRTKLETQTHHMDTCHLWQGLNNTMGHKMKQSKKETKPHPSLMNSMLSMLGCIPAAQCHLPKHPQRYLYPLSLRQRQTGLPGSQPKESDGPRQCSWSSTQILCGPTVGDNHQHLQPLPPKVKVFTCFKKTAIIPIPKKTHAMCLNDYCPVALTSIIMKFFE